MGWGQGWEAREGGDACIIMADFHYCMLETNTTLQNKMIKKKKREKKFPCLPAFYCFESMTWAMAEDLRETAM